MNDGGVTHLFSFFAQKVRKEIEQCYELINKLGRGVVYLGSSRMGPDHSHYLQALELGREASFFILFKAYIHVNACNMMYMKYESTCQNIRRIY